MMCLLHSFVSGFFVSCILLTTAALIAYYIAKE